MSSIQNSAEDYKRAYDLQKKAREKAERLLEDKSRELYLKNESLEKALEKLVDQQSQLVAQEKLASIGQLGAGLAHELNNPNAFIQNNIQTLNEYIVQLLTGLDDALALAKSLQESSPQAAQSQKAIQTIKRITEESDLEFIRGDLDSIIDESLKGTKRITSIANGLRYFANPDLSTRKPVNINECIQQASQLLPKLHQHVAVRFKPGQLPETSGMPLLLSQALVNIMINAIEAKPKSGFIDISVCVQDTKIIIEVTDDGVGIETGLLDKVLQPFFTTYNDHNGLGLSIANSIILQHEGTLEITSTAGQGTTATIALPIVDD